MLARLSAWSFGGDPGSPAETPRTIGRYAVERRLGQGGMADVFLCRQLGMGGFDRLVVVKQIRGDLRGREDIIHMFLDEARIAALISHPNVVQTIEMDESDGLPYLAMEYVKGVSLAAMQRAHAERGLRPQIELVAAIGAQACEGLHAAHELRDTEGQLLGVVHRDISPTNLMLSTHGVVKIIDFGIARAKNRLARTAVGQIKGRMAYLAPELAASGIIDRRADLFSLAVVLHELLSGKVLFERADDLSTLGAVLSGEVPALSGLRDDMDPELDAVLREALAADPARRPQSAETMGARLWEVVLRRGGGHFAAPGRVAQYLRELMPSELGALPDHRVPTTSRLPLSERLELSQDPLEAGRRIPTTEKTAQAPEPSPPAQSDGDTRRQTLPKVERMTQQSRWPEQETAQVDLRRITGEEATVALTLEPRPRSAGLSWPSLLVLIAGVAGVLLLWRSC